MKIHHLYIDELGNPNPSSTAHKYFILSACSIPDGARESAKRHAGYIKFKYWGLGGNELVLHSAEIGRKSGAFAIFKNDPVRYGDFLNDLLDFLKSHPITLFVNVTDHTVAKVKNWDTKTVLAKSSNHIVGSFVRYVVGCRTNGKIVIESATDEQNNFFLKAFTYHLAPNAIKGIKYQVIQEALTSMSVVTKNNHDIEEQIADLFAYAAKCKYERDQLGISLQPASYEARLVSLLEKRLYRLPRTISPTKRMILSKVESYKILTK